MNAQETNRVGVFIEVCGDVYRAVYTAWSVQSRETATLFPDADAGRSCWYLCSYLYFSGAAVKRPTLGRIEGQIPGWRKINLTSKQGNVNTPVYLPPSSTLGGRWSVTTPWHCDLWNRLNSGELIAIRSAAGVGLQEQLEQGFRRFCVGTCPQTSPQFTHSPSVMSPVTSSQNDGSRPSLGEDPVSGMVVEVPFSSL